MAGFGLEVKAKKMFFDRPLVEKILGKQAAKVLSKAGAFVRRRARSSLRRRKKPSMPGNPPSVHSNSPVASLKNIWFALDPNTLSVVVGPLRLNQKQYLGAVLTSGSVPGIHEFGGTLGIREKLENLAPQLIRAKRKGPPRNLTAAQKAAMLRRKGNVIPEYVPGTKWVRMGRRKPLSEQPVRVRLASYPKRAFMQPALQAEVPNFPSLFMRVG